MIDLMLDVESLGNIPGCVLCQYTLVPFNINGKKYEGHLQPFDQYLHIGQQIAEGYDVDVNTLAWWMTQPVEIRRVVFGGTLFIHEFCGELERYLGDVTEQHTSYRIWSTSAKVDFGIPPVLFKRSDFPYPVFHRAERCARTFLEMVKLKHPQMKPVKSKVTHNAIDDCNKQIEELQLAYATLMEKEIKEEAVQSALEDNIRTTF